MWKDFFYLGVGSTKVLKATTINDTIMTPQILRIKVRILPGVVFGKKSPYPIVVMVTTVHQTQVVYLWKPCDLLIKLIGSSATLIPKLNTGIVTNKHMNRNLNGEF